MHVNDIIEKPEAGKRKRKGLLICGMHRSGTSLTAGIMCQIGAAAPNTLMEANEYNKTGYWESNVFCKLNDRILSEAGSAWHDLMPINPSFFKSNDAENHISAICAAIETEFADDALICVKDPRIARIFPLWLAAFQKLRIEPLVIIPIRNPLDVAASLKKRNDFSFSYAQMLWLRYVLDCERHSRGTKRSFVSYEGLLTDWRGCVTNIANELGIAWPKYQSRSVARVERMVSERYRHHDSSLVDLNEHAHVSSVVKSVSQALLDATSGNRSDVQKPLTTASIQLSAADLLYAELLADREIERDVERGAVAALRKEADEQKAARAAAENALSEAHAAASKAEEAHRLELEQRGEKLKAAEALLEKVKDERTEVHHQLTAIRKEADEQKAARTAAENALSEARAAAAKAEEALQLDISQKEESIAAAMVENASLKQRVSDASCELEKVLAEVLVLSSKLDQASDNANKHVKEAEALRNERETLKSDVANLSQKLDVRVRELAQITQMFQDSDDQLAELRQQLSRYLISTAKAVGKAITGFVGFSVAKVPTDAELAAVFQKLTEARLFDLEYYCESNPDVAKAEMDPFMHYIVHGAAEGRAPFDLAKIAEEAEKDFGKIS